MPLQTPSTTSSNPASSLGSDLPPDPLPEPVVGVDPAVVTAIVNGYYPKVLDSGLAARTRAQAAQSATSAFAGLVSGGLALSALHDGSTVAALAGIVALALWAVAALGYVLTIGASVAKPDAVKGTSDTGELVRIVLDRAESDRKKVEGRLRVANVLGLLALTATVTAGVSLILADEPSVSATVITTDAGALMLQRQCHALSLPLHGHVDPTKLTDEIIVVDVDGPACDGTDQVQVAVPRALVQAVILSQ